MPGLNETLITVIRLLLSGSLLAIYSWEAGKGLQGQ